jgi:tetratricopeptide (TPR) repeat protein
MPKPITAIHALSRTCILRDAILSIVITCAWAQTGSEPTGAIASALRNQQFDKALDLLAPALQKSATNAQLWTMQGVAYAGQNKNADALASFHQALRLSPDYLPALRGAAQIEYQAGSPSAIPLIQHVLRLQPDDRTGHGMLAVLEYQQGNCARAVPHFEKAGALFDARASALHAYGVCLVRLKKLDRAIPVFQKTVALSPGEAQERRLLASVQLMAHKPQDALATLRLLLQSSDVDVDTLELASAAYEDSGDTSQSVGTLRQAILLDPQNVNLYLDFAHISYAHDSFQVGINVVSDGIALQPGAAPLYLARGVLYVQLAQYDKAEADFDKAHDLDPRQSLSAAAQGVAASQENDLGRALATVEEKLVRRPNDPLLLYLQADFILQRGAAAGSPESQLALRSARKAVELQPTLTEARNVLAKLYLQSGQFKEAAQQSRQVLNHDPQDQSAVYHLILALRKTGQTAEIPGLLKKLAQLREEAAKEQSRRNRYKLVDDENQSKEQGNP